MEVGERFHNLERARPGRSGTLYYGYARSGRAFLVFVATRAPPVERWSARALTPREGAVNKITAASLLAISIQLEAMD